MCSSDLLGMAGGMAVLGGIVAGPVLAVGGLVLAAKAEKNLAKARETDARAQVLAAELDAARGVVEAIRAVATQFHEMLRALDARVTWALDDLERAITRSGTDYSRFAPAERRAVHTAVLFASTLKVLLDTPLLTPEGGLAGDGAQALEKGQALLAGA